jgi:hypothetical protein
MIVMEKVRAVGLVAVLLPLLVSSGCAVRKPIKVVTPGAQQALSAWITAVKSGIEEVGASATKKGGASDIKQPGASDIFSDITGRNLAISYSEAAVMANYMTFRDKLSDGRAGAKVFFDIVELGLTTAVPISKGARAKTILGSLATGFKGSNLSIDRNIFNDKSTATILSAMDSCVMRQKSAIADKISLPVDRYTIYNAYGDLTRLYGCTTVAGALQELSENQAVAARQAQERTLIAPISKERLLDLREIQIAFVEALRVDKKRALGFLIEMKV